MNERRTVKALSRTAGWISQQGPFRKNGKDKKTYDALEWIAAMGTQVPLRGELLLGTSLTRLTSSGLDDGFR